jgi:DNA-binding IclR family transcriptional regulator
VTPASLEELDRQVAVAREQGFCAAFGERHVDVRPTAAPVFDHTREPAVAPGLGLPTQRVTEREVERLRPVVARATAEASERLGHDPALRRLSAGESVGVSGG